MERVKNFGGKPRGIYLVWCELSVWDLVQREFLRRLQTKSAPAPAIKSSAHEVGSGTVASRKPPPEEFGSRCDMLLLEAMKVFAL